MPCDTADGPDTPSPVPGPPAVPHGFREGARSAAGTGGDGAGGSRERAEVGSTGREVGRAVGQHPKCGGRAGWGPARPRPPAPRRRAPRPRAAAPPGRPRRRHARARRARRRPARRAPALTLVGLDRDPQALALAGRRLAAFADRTHLVHAVYDRIAEVLAELGLPRSTACCSTSACRRCSSTPTSAASPTPATPTSTCGWTPATGPTAADVLNTYPPAELARVLRSTARSGSPAGSPPPSCGGGRSAADGAAPSSSSCSTTRAGGVPADRRAPGEADVPGAAHRGQRRAGRAARAPAGRARRARRRRADRRAGLPLARGPDRQARAGRARDVPDARSGCRSSCPGTGRSCGCSPAAPRAGAEEIADNPRAASVRLRAAERIGEDAA